LKKTQKTDPILLLIDGNHLAHRCRHVFSLSYMGKDVSVTYGFLKTLKSIMGKFDPHAVVVCWDGGIPEFRRKLIPEYKANRHQDDDQAAWEDFNRQMQELCDRVLPLMGILSVRKLKAEGDDLLYHASRISALPSIIVTGDRDLFQAVDENTSVYSPHKEKLYRPADIQAEFGISQEQFVHWKALQGDSSDNIPGVPGIGDKTATKLFQEYGNLSCITNAAAGINAGHNLSGKLATNICEFGMDRLARNIQAIALFRDKTGAKMALREAANNYIPFAADHTKRFLMANGFTSLFEFLGDLGRLHKPEFRDDVRYPFIEPRRMPI
jgi:DNA polymerase I